MKFNLGVTRIKSAGGAWKPIKQLWHKTTANTWTPVKTAWIKTTDSTWERIYPTPAGNLLVTGTTAFNPYQFYSDVKTLTLTNIGDYTLVINDIIANDSADFVTTVDLTRIGGGTPITLEPNASATIDVSVYGSLLNTNSPGNITFVNDIGYLGYGNTTVDTSVSIAPDFNGITVLPTTLTVGQWFKEPAVTGNISIINSGIGANLNIFNISSANTVVSVSNIPNQSIGFNFTTLSGNVADFTWQVINSNPGTETFVVSPRNPELLQKTFRDTLTINSNAYLEPALKIPVEVNYITPIGAIDFTTPGTYEWIVPDHVYDLTVFGVGAGGGGGGGEEVGNGAAGGGGGSGDYQEQLVEVTPGETLTITVGAGGAASPFVGRTTNAPGGSAGGTTTISGSFGTITIAGGSGGGGGSSAETNRGGGKIICTKLYEIGLLDKIIYQADQAFGAELVKERPDVYNGYRAWAEVVVEWMDGTDGKFMQAWATKWAVDIATPWAKHMAYSMGTIPEDSQVGRVIALAGVPVCKLAGMWRRLIKVPVPKIVTKLALIPVFTVFKLISLFEKK